MAKDMALAGFVKMEIYMKANLKTIYSTASVGNWRMALTFPKQTYHSKSLPKGNILENIRMEKDMV